MSSKPLTLAAGAVALCVLASSCAKKHAAQATVQIVSAPGETAGLPYSTLIQTRIEVIQARATLERVVDGIDLAKVWDTDRDKAIDKVKKNLSIEPIKGTDLLQIRVHDTDPATAAKIANGVAESFRDRMSELMKSATEKSLKSIEEQVEAQRQRAENDPAETEKLNEMLELLAREKVDAASPRSSVIIHERAEAPR